MIVHLRVPLPADETRVPVEEHNCLWTILVKEVAVGSNIRRATIKLKWQATRRLERQRRGEVPNLAVGFIDVFFELVHWSSIFRGKQALIRIRRIY